MGKSALALGRFLGQDVAFVSVLTLYFAGARHQKALFGARLGFILWHWSVKKGSFEKTATTIQGKIGAEYLRVAIILRRR